MFQTENFIKCKKSLNTHTVILEPTLAVYILNSNKNAYFIFCLFLYESGYVLTSKQFEKHQQCMLFVLKKKPLENLYSVMHGSRMNAYGVKSKSHLVYLTSENCFLVENFGISLFSSFSDYLRKCLKLYLVAISTCLTRFCPFD